MFISEILDKRMEMNGDHVYFCTKCVNSNQRFGLQFDDKGVCDACNYAVEKGDSIDWEQRERELQQLCERFRSKDGSIDCLVPSSGGKDSCYVAHQLKYEYGMHPLTVTFAPAMFTDIGWKNYQNLCSLFDNLMAYPQRTIHSKIALLGFELLGDIFTPWHCGKEAFPLQVALKYNIPLMFYGEKQGVEYGGGRRGGGYPRQEVQDRDLDKSIHFLDQLVKTGIRYGVFKEGEIKEKTLEMYTQPEEKLMQESGLEVHWFSYYKKWIPQENYYYAQENCGFEPNPERSEGTYHKYASLDDKTDGLYYYMQLIKIGIGRCTSDASQEIRSNLITRDEAVALVHKYDTEFPKKYFRENLEYMGITEEHFHRTVDKFRPPHLWNKRNGEWQLKYQVV